MTTMRNETITTKQDLFIPYFTREYHIQLIPAGAKVRLFGNDVIYRGTLYYGKNNIYTSEKNAIEGINSRFTKYDLDINELYTT